ncbi:non-specific lipid-transfer protein 1-like [Curcuma longa]|uniref:non-specific lipid-transfer protein 1-like n=1 Tax=Curcuma longa TaxID=136217 RepID=UPI003D9DF694
MARSSACALAVVLVLVAAIALLAGSSQVDAAVTCGQVASDLRPCVPYVTGQVSAAPPACCNGVRGLNSGAQTTADRRAACNCIRSQASGISGLQPGRLSGLPGSCGVHLPFPISASTDCSSVS